MKKIRIGQIGIGHNHASEKMSALRRLTDCYEVVGVVEPDEQWWEKRGNFKDYQGIPRLTEEELSYLEEPYRPHPIVGAIDHNPPQGVMLLDEKK